MPEYINNSYSKNFQLTWYCGIYKVTDMGFALMMLVIQNRK